MEPMLEGAQAVAGPLARRHGGEGPGHGRVRGHEALAPGAEQQHLQAGRAGGVQGAGLHLRQQGLKLLRQRRRGAGRGDDDRLGPPVEDEQEQPAEPGDPEGRHGRGVVPADFDAGGLGLADPRLEVLGELGVAGEAERRQPIQRTAILGPEVVPEVEGAGAVGEVTDVVDAQAVALGDLGDAEVHADAPLEGLHHEGRTTVGDDGGLLDAERHVERVVGPQQPPEPRPEQEQRGGRGEADAPRGAGGVGGHVSGRRPGRGRDASGSGAICRPSAGRSAGAGHRCRNG